MASIRSGSVKRSGSTRRSSAAASARRRSTWRSIPLRAVHLPIEAGFDVGACAGIPIMTAHRCVHADGPIAGQTVLVTGGAGRVGYYAIQWAKMAGAKVIASASNAARRGGLP